MDTNNKRKWRWSSKSLFSPKISKYPTAQDRSSREDADRAINPSTLLELSFVSSSSQDGRTGSRLSSKKHRTNSKLLSVVGFQRSGGIGARTIQKSSSHTSERDIALAIVRDAVKPSSSSPSRADPYNGLGHPFMRQDKNGPSQELDEQHVPLAPVSESDTRMSACGPQIESISVNLKPRHPKGLQKSMSNPSFVHQMSHKLSQTFGNPTVVHRRDSRTRFSLNSIQDNPMVNAELESDQEISPHDSTAPSSYNYSGSATPTDPSTGKTSLASPPGTPQLVMAQEGREIQIEAKKAGHLESGLRERTLTPIQEIPHPITPTLVTVETTANAKIFFETHFNSLLAGHISPRSIRRRDLEYHLNALAIPEEEREFERWTWANHESDHLRQSRALKSRSNECTTGSGVAIAGYEIVRILGKGSFGVVRLVREKDFETSGPLVEQQQTQPAHGSKQQITRARNSGLKTTAIEPLRFTVNGHKIAPHQGVARPRREVYAMKVIRKSDMLRNCQEGHLRAERDFLVASEKSRWVVPLVASFQDNTNLYLVMEYMVGGDFLGLLFREDKLKEKRAKWYIAEMILCVEETHRLRWIHRDIKPDNFLISSSGHLKISDFGLAFDGHWAHDQRYYKNTRASLMEKLGIRVKGDSEDQKEDENKKPRSSLANILTGRKPDLPPKAVQFDGPNEKESVLQWKNRTGKRKMAASVVGTSQYMAPEVIRGDPYDGRCDWWSIGIILYECLYGSTPFVCENREDTKNKILDNSHSLEWPDERAIGRTERISFEARDIINSLLQEREHRLSSRKYRMNDWQTSRQRLGHLTGRRVDMATQNFAGYFVYPDDASDIKAHPFFHRIGWERHHLTRPPWVPHVSGQEDTKWFNDEDGIPVSDVDERASRSDDREDASDQETNDGYGSGQLTQVDGANARMPVYSPIVAAEADGAVRKKTAKDKAKKRPRDRVLRDKEVGRKALDLRKKGAFLGYTYRRPRLMSFEDERERQRAARRPMVPSFD